MATTPPFAAQANAVTRLSHDLLRWLYLEPRRASSTRPANGDTVFVRTDTDLRLDRAVKELQSAACEVLDAGKRLILDLRNVQHANARTVATLVLIRRKVGRQGTALSLLASPTLRKWIEICRADAVLGLARPT